MSAIEIAAPTQGDVQRAFLEMLPQVEKQLRYEFRRLRPEAAAEAVQEGVAVAFQSFVRLQQQGRTDVASAGSLAHYAARRVRAGRKVGSSLNVRDPLSRYAQRRQGITVHWLDQPRLECGQWIEAAIADRKTPIPERVALRVDLPEWLGGLSRRIRRIAKDLAIGFTTGDVAQKYGVSSGRVSQIRQELFRSWEQFHWNGPPAV